MQSIERQSRIRIERAGGLNAVSPDWTNFRKIEIRYEYRWQNW